MKQARITWTFHKMRVHYTVFFDSVHLLATSHTFFRLDHSPNGGQPTIDEDMYWCLRLTKKVQGSLVALGELKEKVESSKERKA